MLAAEPAEELRRNIALVLAGEPAPWFRVWHDEVDARRRNGEPLTVEFLVAPLREGSGWRFNIFIFDISERARTWQEHARMAAIVEFVRRRDLQLLLDGDGDELEPRAPSGSTATPPRR